MIKLKTLIDVLLSLLTIRIIVKGASIGDALAFISLAGCYSYHEFLKLKEKIVENEKRPDPNKEILEKIELIEKKAFEKIELIEKKTSNTEAKIAGLTLSGRGLR